MLDSYLTIAYANYRKYGSKSTLQELPCTETKAEYVAPQPYQPSPEMLNLIKILKNRTYDKSDRKNTGV